MSLSSYNYTSSSNDTGSVRILSEQLSTAAAINGSSGSTIATRGGGVGSELKLYQAFIFSVPIFFTFILLLLFYFFFRRRVNWSSLRNRATSVAAATATPISSMCELEGGLSKELREMLPVIIFNQTFYVKDTQCSVCLGDFQAEEKLQQIPGCGHTFHVDCIDLWLASHTTCPLCRHSLEFTKPADGPILASPVENNDNVLSLAHSGDENSSSESTNGDPQTSSLHTSGGSFSENDEENQLTQNGAHMGNTKIGI